jgi:PII-like signaling protein
MKMEGQGKLLRIFIGESDRWRDKPLHEAIVAIARERGMAGATVLRGMIGFGAHSRLHTTKILRLSEDLPLIVEIVDRAEKIQELIPVLDGMIADGMMTLETVEVISYRAPAPPA